MPVVRSPVVRSPESAVTESAVTESAVEESAVKVCAVVRGRSTVRACRGLERCDGERCNGDALRRGR